MHGHGHHSVPRRPRRRGIRLWLILLFGFLLLVIGLTLLDGQPGNVQHLFHDTTVSSEAPQPASHAALRDS
jgi:hypothetical protein